MHKVTLKLLILTSELASLTIPKLTAQNRWLNLSWTGALIGSVVKMSEYMKSNCGVAGLMVVVGIVKVWVSVLNAATYTFLLAVTQLKVFPNKFSGPRLLLASLVSHP